MPLDIRIRFGRAIRRIREEQKINQEEAAERCGLHRTYYSGIERGEERRACCATPYRR
jgi:transcriptional regulator with XRE-family HTH domain